MDNNIIIYNEIKGTFSTFYKELTNLINSCRDYSNFNHKLILNMIDALLAINEGIVITKDIHKNNRINYNFNKTIVLLFDALKYKDDVYCADLLIYEIKSEIELWKNIFNI